MNRWTRLLLLTATCALMLALGTASAFAKDASADIDQCANGPITAIVACDDVAWQNGNLNGNQAHWFEGDFVPYRLKFADLVDGQSYIVQLQYDTTKSGKHSLDYLGTYDRTETTGAADPTNFHANQNDPCGDYLTVAQCVAPTTPLLPGANAIPEDSTMTARPDWGGGATGSTGDFTMWGGAVSNVSNQSYSGDWASDSSATIYVTFTAATNGTGKAVLAWAGHIATRQNWGVNNSAISIPGSPYHMRLLNLDPPDRGGNQDRSLSADAVIYPASVTIVKETASATTQAFAFTAAGTGFTFPYPTSTDASTTFSLDTAAGGNPFSLTSNRIVTFGTQRTVTEAEPNSLWTLDSVSCSVTAGIGGGGTAAQDGTNPLQTNFDLQEGDIASCTYVNEFTPASTSITTQVTDSSITIGDSTTDTAELSGGFGTLTGTITWKLYSDSTCTTQVGSDITQTVNGAGPYSFPAGSSVTPTAIGDYYWYAEYTSNNANNSGSHTGCADASEKVTVSKDKPAILTHATTSVTIGTQISDQAVVTGGYQTGGRTVHFDLYLAQTGDNAPTCDQGHFVTRVNGTLPANPNGSGQFIVSVNYTPTVAGTYYWVASMDSNTNNDAADHEACGDSDETSVVTKATPAIVTHASQSVTIGSQISDQAVVTGGYQTGGRTVHFDIYTDCQANPIATVDGTLPANPNGSSQFIVSVNYTPAAVGTYYWVARMDANANNNAATHEACGDPDETSLVTKVKPNIVTHATQSVTIGTQISDQAVVTGGYQTGGRTVHFDIYTDCQGNPVATVDGTLPANPNGSGQFIVSVNYTPTTAGTYYWVASMDSNANNDAADHEACGDPDETSVVNKDKPAIVTHATQSVTIGTKISDQAVVTGGYQTGGRTVHFDIYTDCQGNPIATVDGTLPANANGNGEYIVSVDYDKPAAAGTYYWVARMDSNANNDAADHEACGDPDETSLVDKDKPDVHTQVSDATIGLGHSVTDNIELTGGYQIAGQDVSVVVYGPNDPTCAAAGTSLGSVTLDGNNKATKSFTPTQPGHYTFVVSYAGDGNNDPAAGLCSDTAEQFDVVAVTLDVKKDPNETHAYDGDKVSFTITAANTGTDAIRDVKVVDNIKNSDHTCETLTLDSGDANSNQLLDPGETWKWTCTVTVVHAEEIGGNIVNVAHIEGATVHGGDFVKSTEDDASVPVRHPAIAIDKSGPATAQAGDKVGYVLTVTNPGDTSFADSKVTIADEQCNGDPVTLLSKGGDASTTSFDPGDTWTYGCRVQTAVGETAVHNVATATGCDEFGKCATASDPADTELTQPEQIVLGARVVPGSAQLLGPTGCVGRAFNARVRGTQIATATFVLDGKVVKRVRNTKNAKLIQFRVDPKKLKIGVHRMVVNLTFKSGSGTKPRSIRLSFQRCGKKLAAPRFTG